MIQQLTVLLIYVFNVNIQKTETLIKEIQQSAAARPRTNSGKIETRILN